ncbi:type II toxin-antitoxin system antitoxin VapB26 [soil metagenome]
MNKTNVYLPDDLKRKVEQLAERRRTSEAEVIREAVRRLGEQERPMPRGGVFASGRSDLSERVDELLASDEERPPFGQR